MFPGWMQIALVVLLIVVLFGRGRISDLMGDVAKGITSFRKGLKDDGTGDGASDSDKASSEPKDVTPRLDSEKAADSAKADSKSKDKTKA